MNKRKLISAGLLPAMLLSACTGRAPSERPAPQVGVRTMSLVAPPDPTDTPYYNYFEKKSDSNEWFNNQLQPTRTIQIAAKELVLADGDTSLLNRFNEDPDVKRLDLYAQKITIRKTVKVPGTEVHIHAEELRFEDGTGAAVVIDTRPDSITTRAEPSVAGKGGLKAGDVYAYVKTLVSDHNRFPRFVQGGGNGQQGGIGTIGVKGAPVLTLGQSKPALATCAQNNGVTGPLVTGSDLKLRFSNPGVTASEIANHTVDLGLDFPANGTDAKAGGKAGNGGDGGNFHAIASDLAVYSTRNGGQQGVNAGYYAGGSAGTPDPAVKLATASCNRYLMCGTDIVCPIGRPPSGATQVYRLLVTGVEKRDIQGGASFTSPSADRPTGTPGAATVDGSPFAWYHPHALEMAIAFAEDAYANDFRELAATELNKQDGLLTQLAASPDYAALPPDDRALFDQAALRVRALLNQLNTHEDYWGNPLGWVPALSLEANVALFQQEVEWAIRTIFVSDWLTDTNNKQKENLAAVTQAKALLRKELTSLQTQFDDAVGKIPQLKASAAETAIDVASNDTLLQVIETRLKQRALSDVQAKHKLPFWKKALRVLAVVARTLPIAQPVLGGIGASLSFILDFDKDKPWESIQGIGDVIGAFKDTDTDKKAKDVKDKTAEQKPEEKKKQSDLKAAVAEIQKYLGPVVAGLKAQKDKFKDAEVKKEELDKEVAEQLKKLEGEDPQFPTLSAKTLTLGAKREQLGKQIEATTTALEEAATKISEHWLELSELLPLLESSSKVVLTQRGEIALNDMREKALRRLKKYQYFLARAYEYRMLKKYPGDLTLTNLFNQMRTLVHDTTSTGVLQPSDYDSLYVLYRNELSEIIQEVAERCNNGAQSYSTSVPYTLSADELDKLNAGESVTFDFWERNAFQDTEEDVRISNVEVTTLDADQVGTGPFPYVDLVTTHSGISRIWRDGKVSVFKHYNKETPQPLTWTTRKQPNQPPEQHLVSASPDSLLHALLPGASSNILMFSTPGAWAQLSMKKVVHGAPAVDFAIRKVVVKLDYDYFPRSLNAPFGRYRTDQETTVNAAYQSLLHRDGTDEEKRAARELLDLGYTDNQLSTFLALSKVQEYMSQKVDDIYSLLYHRAPTADEVSFWAAELADGRPELQVRSYVQSITDTFTEIYHRTPNYEELKTFTQLLDDGVPL